MTRITKWRLAGAALAVAFIATLPYTVTPRRWLYDFLPLLVLLACPVMHLLVHRRHGRHAAHAGAPSHALPDEPAIAPVAPHAGRGSAVPIGVRAHGHTSS